MGILAQLRLALGLQAPPRRPPPVRCSAQGSRRLIAYLTGGSQGWILEFLWRDLTVTAEWCEQIQHCLQIGMPDAVCSAPGGSHLRQAYLHRARFEQLARQLRQLCDQPVVEGNIK